MADLTYELLDVFTRILFTGNQLAVFVDAPPLSSDQMQRIAAELHLSETVFVSTPEGGGTWPTRIFPPSSELPFAGHPTIGTAVLLAASGRVGPDLVVLAEGVEDVGRAGRAIRSRGVAG